MRKVVAVTGGIGSGKSEVCQIFTTLGVPVVDLDQIAHDMSAPGSPAMQAVKEKFGASMFNVDGQLNRARLRELVFAEPDALEQLNQIMHPAIRVEAIRQIGQYADPYVVLAIPLLVESREDWRMIDHVLVVDCDAQTQLERLMQRSQLSEGMAQAMIAAQSDREARLSIADSVIENDQTLDKLAQKVQEFHKNFSKTCQ
ncbi:dephospho-CoA kinase [Methylophilus medardicus]|uniref:Dephospho-CoA kinase n=1 Tax=Methylophilus medardicus TaxID=2588534 RepID=A0A5B8CRC7_9PROT|nr:dephospho-CoA kinase [Methylophilus medardicus]QDC43729.1 dephospho-CoA kinase [Methylophilus medardicus]QDC48736.1 dephospho-CoA kinase [Methylophilus medardicus]QDC52441.1 dephospho-CoA kinase [Methylophilus medardicus]